MAEGYFDDGTTHIELGEHVFALPTGRRRNVRLDPHDQAARVLDSGGGVLELEVTAQRMRANLGDAERYAYEILRALALSDPGTLAYEDNRGYRHTWGRAVCTGGRAEIKAFRFVDMSLDFECPEKRCEPPWGSVPATPATWAGTATLQDYELRGGAVSPLELDLAGVLTLEMSRSRALREIPRARGARASEPARGAEMRFLVEIARVADAENLATDIQDLIRDVGPRQVNLIANGNRYAGLLLESARPDPTDARHTMLELEFVQDLTEGAAGIYTTTAAPTTTTTTAGG